MNLRGISLLYLCCCLLLFSLCACKHLIQEPDIKFSCTLEAAQDVVYLKEKGQVELVLTINSDQQEAQKATYVLRQWKVSEDQKGNIDKDINASLHYGANTITYSPKSTGKHILELTVDVSGEENTEQTTQKGRCTLEVKEYPVVPYEASLQTEKAKILPGKWGSFVLNIQSKAEQGKAMDYHVKHWEVVQLPRDASNSVQGTLCTTKNPNTAVTATYTLKIGQERLYYIPSGNFLGTYELRITLANVYGDERKIHAQFQGVQAEYTIHAVLDDVHHIGVEIATEEPGLSNDTWQLVSHKWSQGIVGDLLTKKVQKLCCGDNKLEFALHTVNLQDRPRLTLQIQGPGGVTSDVEVDLTQACQQYVLDDLGGKDASKFKKHVEGLAAAYQYHIDDKDIKAKKKKRRELEKLLVQSQQLQTRWTARLGFAQQNSQYLAGMSSSAVAHSATKGENEFVHRLEEASTGLQALLEQLTSEQEVMRVRVKALSDLGGTADPSQALFKALKERNQDNIALFLNSPDLDVNVVDSKGRSLLHRAVQYGQIDAAVRLIEEGIGVDAKDKSGRTASMVAARKGNLEMLKLLWRKGANLGVVKKGSEALEDFTLMHFAAYHGHVEIIKFLVKNGRKHDLNVHGKNGAMPASGPRYWAMLRKHVAANRVLKQYGACVWATGDGEKFEESELENILSVD